MKDQKVGSNAPCEYGANSQPQKMTADHLIRQHQHLFKKGDILVDIGCGTGAISAALSKSVGLVYAFDLSSTAIEYAKEKYPLKEYPNLLFFAADATSFSLPEKVDWAFSANSLHWLKPAEQKLALGCIKKVLKDDGKLIITFGMRHEPLWTIVDEFVLSENWSRYFTSFQNPRAFYTVEEYKKLLVAAGFEVLSIQAKPITYTFKDLNELLKFVRSWLPHINCIPVEKHEQYMQALGIEYVKRLSARTDGSLYMTFNVLEVAAQKYIFSKKLTPSITKNEEESKGDESFNTLPRLISKL